MHVAAANSARALQTEKQYYADKEDAYAMRRDLDHLRIRETPEDGVEDAAEALESTRISTAA